MGHPRPPRWLESSRSPHSIAGLGHTALRFYVLAETYEGAVTPAFSTQPLIQHARYFKRVLNIAWLVSVIYGTHSTRLDTCLVYGSTCLVYKRYLNKLHTASAAH